MSAEQVEQLRLDQAVADEALAVRNLLVEEPGWGRLSANASAFAKYLTNLLLAGYSPDPELSVGARKAEGGVRPVSLWSPGDRVVYRALAQATLRNGPTLDRSASAYLSFAKAPIKYASSRRPNKRIFSLVFSESPVNYVVKSDIAAFYQFIDHDILATELIAQGCDYEFVAPLVELLEEIQGRRFGLPQLLDPSDWLSEVYVDRIERRMLQHGYAIWRFNDDFRIACDNYTDVLNATEHLSMAARDNGLCINESKTKAVHLYRYSIDTLGLEESEVGGVIPTDDVEAVVGDYTDDFAGDDDVDAASAVINGASEHGHNGESIRLTDVGPEQVRIMRRALNALARTGSADATANVSLVLSYVPSLTPSAFEYLVAIGGTARSESEAAVGDVIRNVSLNEWQRVWVADTIRRLGTLRREDSTHVQEFAEWLFSVREDAEALIASATATWTLADAGYLSLTDLLDEAGQAPGPLLPIFAAAVDAVAPRPRRSDTAKRIRALAADVQMRTLLAI